MPTTTAPVSLHRVPLQQLPPAFEVPANLRDRFWYDEDRRCLVFDGFMSRAAYDQLSRLHVEPGYRIALDELFRLAAGEVPQTKSSLWWFAGVMAALAAAGLLFKLFW